MLYGIPKIKCHNKYHGHANYTLVSTSRERGLVNFFHPTKYHCSTRALWFQFTSLGGTIAFFIDAVLNLLAIRGTCEEMSVYPCSPCEAELTIWGASHTTNRPTAPGNLGLQNIQIYFQTFKLHLILIDVCFWSNAGTAANTLWSFVRWYDMVITEQ